MPSHELAHFIMIHTFQSYKRSSTGCYHFLVKSENNYSNCFECPFFQIFTATLTPEGLLTALPASTLKQKRNDI